MVGNRKRGKAWTSSVAKKKSTCIKARQDTRCPGTLEEEEVEEDQGRTGRNPIRNDLRCLCMSSHKAEWSSCVARYADHSGRD